MTHAVIEAYNLPLKSRNAAFWLQLKITKGSNRTFFLFFVIDGDQFLDYAFPDLVPKYLFSYEEETMKQTKTNMKQFHKRLQAQDNDPLFTALRKLTKTKNPKAFTNSPTVFGTWGGWNI